MPFQVVFFFAALAAAHCSLLGPLGYGAPYVGHLGLVAKPLTVSKQSAVINHVAPVGPIIGHGLVGPLGLAGHGLLGVGPYGLGPYGVGKLAVAGPLGLAPYGLGHGRVGLAGPIYGGLGKAIW